MSANPTVPPTEAALPSRREFLYYLGGVSATLFSAGACGLLYQYVARSVPLEQREGVYEVKLELLPTDSIPEGILSLNGMCTFNYGVFPKWVDVNNRFECPVCGSKYKRDGTFIEGIAPRGLDRYGLWIRTPEGRLIASEGEPISIDDAVQIFIDTRVKIPGQPRL